VDEVALIQNTISHYAPWLIALVSDDDAAGGDRSLWARDITRMMLIATASGVLAGYAGLLVSFHSASLPARRSF